MLFRKLFRKVKNTDKLDIILMKAGMLFLTLFLLKVIPSFMDWTYRVNIWVLVLIIIVLFIRPCYKCWMASKNLEQ